VLPDRRGELKRGGAARTGAGEARALA